jgi:hypothetical protein
MCGQRTFDKGLTAGSQVGAQGFNNRPEGRGAALNGKSLKDLESRLGQ